MYLYHVNTVHPYISIINASVFKYVRLCLGNTLAALFLSRCCTLVSSLWLLLCFWSQSDCLDGPHLSLSQLQLPGAPVSLCPPGIKAYSMGDVCIFTASQDTGGLSHMADTHTHTILRHPMCIEVFLAADDI